MKKEKIPSIVSIAILTLITSVFWIFFSVYRIFTSKTFTKIPQEILLPFSPELDLETISKIENRVFIEENQIPETSVPNINQVPNLEIKELPEATESGEVSQ